MACSITQMQKTHISCKMVWLRIQWQEGGISAIWKELIEEFWLYLHHRFPDPILKETRPACILNHNLLPLPLLSSTTTRHVLITRIMGTQYLRLSFVVFVIILTISQQSSCRFMHKSMSEKTKRFNSYSQFSWHFSAKGQEGYRKEDTGRAYGVSVRAVPGGPNPLHNWSACL